MSSFLPGDLLALAFCQLNLVDFLAVTLVCHAWHAAARKRTAWPKGVRIKFTASITQCLFSRPLADTVWASCACLDMRPCDLTHALALPHVSDLSLVCDPIDEPTILQANRSMLSRLTTLHTNSAAIADATPYNRLNLSDHHKSAPQLVLFHLSHMDYCVMRRR
jgi:hypothetical protein